MTKLTGSSVASNIGSKARYVGGRVRCERAAVDWNQNPAKPCGLL